MGCLMPRLLDLFAGRCGWSKAFAERGWECVAVDFTMPTTPVPAGIEYRLMDVLTITPSEMQGFDFICASSPCEQFSVHGMKHFHPNPPYPEMGIKLFNHTRMLCESSGVPYVMENVRAAQAFVGTARHHCGPFYLWGSGVPPLMNQGIQKGIQLRGSVKGWQWKTMTLEQRRETRKTDFMIQYQSGSEKRKAMTALAATIPPELASCVCDYAERLIEP